MKKIVSILCTAALIASLTGCNNGVEKPDTSDNSQVSSPVSDSSDSIDNPGGSESSDVPGGADSSDSSDSSDGQSGAFKPWEPVDIASLPVKHVDWGDIFDDPVRGAFQITDKLGENYYGSRSTLNAVIESEEVLMSADKKEFRSLKYPENFPDWRYGSGAFVTLGDRYYYNWLSYTSQFSPDSLHDVKLTRVDGNTGEVTVVDEVESVLPFIYLVKIDDESFLSYSVMPDTSDFGTLTNASIYYSDGTKKDIISEKYQNEADWTDSIGTLIENFAVKDGEIYGFGRRRISGEYKFFLYHYNKDGELLDTAELPGMESIMGDRQAMEFSLVGDYLIFRSYEDLKRYICRITDSGVELVAGKIHYAVSGSKIFFIERNVDDSGNIKDKEIPLYSIDTETDEITAVNFEVPEEKPYFNTLMSLSNGDLVFEYCPGGQYDPLNYISYILPIGRVNELIGNAEYTSQQV